MNRFSGDVKAFLVSFLLISSVVLAANDPNLVGWWRFDETSGDICNDSSCYDSTGTILNGGTFQTGLYGNALSLDGYDQTAYIPHSDILKPKKQMTICFWVKFNALDRYCYFYDKSDSAGVNSLTISGSPGAYYLQGALQTTNNKCILKHPITDTEFLDSNWHLLAVTYDGQYVRLYKNGLQVEAMYSPGELMTYGNANIYLGSIGNYSTEVARFDGLMDDLRVYSRALTADELAVMAGIEPAPENPPAPPIDNNDLDPNLLGLWKFEEQFGTKAYDSSSNNKDGDIIGKAWHVNGITGDSLLLAGNGEIVQIPDEQHFDIEYDITISCWVKLAQNEENVITFVSKGNAFCLYREMFSDSIIFFSDYIMPLLSQPTNINDGKWHHIAATYDGTNRSIYFDGMLNRQLPTTTPLFTNDHPVTIGTNPDYSNSHFSGQIDDVRIYNRALTAEEIRNLAAVKFAVANSPSPADQQIDVPLDEPLTFQSGLWAANHDIYFGTDFDDVNNADTNSATFQGNTDSNSFTPPTLDLNKVYYWRVDEVNDTEIFKGKVWTFATLDQPIDPSLVAQWKFDEGSGFEAHDSSGKKNHATIQGDCTWSNSKEDFCINTTQGTDNKIVATNESRFDITDEITIALWINKKDWNIWASDDRIISKGDDAWYISRDGGWSAESNIRGYLKNVGTVRSTGKYAVNDGKWHHIALTYDGSAMSLYVDGNQDSTLAASGNIGTTDLPLVFARNLKDNGDECDYLCLKDARIYSRALDAEEIVDIATFKWATNPTPKTQQQVSSSQVTLSFKPGHAAHSTNLYFSDDFHSVNLANTDSNAFEASIPADCNSCIINDLQPRTTYYWRADTLRNGKTYKGKVWSFYVTSPGGDLQADIDRDGKVNLQDFAQIGKSWTKIQTPTAANLMQATSTAATKDKVSLSLNNIYTDIKLDSKGIASFDCQSKVFSLSNPAEPQIPWQVATIMLPADADLSTLNAIADIEFKPVEGNFNVRPEPPLTSWIDGQNITYWPEDKNIENGKDIDIYQKDLFWPAENVRILDAGQLRKYKLAKVAVPLVKYNPVTSQLIKLSKANIDIVFEKISAMVISSTSQPDNIGEKRVKEMAVNFDQFASDYKAAPMTALDTNSVDPNTNTYCIITTNQIVDCSTKLADFITHKESMGFRVIVVTEDQCGSGLTGRSKMLAIRAWLQENYLSENIEYVLLIGNPRINATKFAIPMMGGDGGNQDKKPTDFMYADLTGDWDINDDDRYATYQGTAHDFLPGGVDCYSEVIVGRIPFYGVFEDLDHILAKTIKYENTPPQDAQWRKSVLAAMEPLNDTEGISAIWAQALRNEIFEPNDWPFFGIYDNDFIPEGAYAELMPCSYYNVTQTWSKGKFGVMTYCSHGSSTKASAVVNTALQDNMNDEYPSAVFAVSCLNASPDNQRNIAYSILINGASSVIAATSYCYSTSDLTNFNNTGSANGQGYEYFSRVTVGKPIGLALYELKAQQGKDTHIFRWFNNMVMNLYGDPALVILPADPADSNNDRNIDYQDLIILANQWLTDHN